MVDIFGVSFGKVALEERAVFVAIMYTNFRGSVECDGIIGQHLSRSLRSRKIFVIVGG